MDPANLNNEVVKLKELLLDWIGKMEAAVKEAEAAAAGQARLAQEIEKSLKSELATLKVQVSEKEELLKSKESALKGLEEGANGKIQLLESELKEKRGLIVVRDVEAQELKSKVETLTLRIVQLQLAVTEAEGLRAAQTRKTDEVENSLKLELAALHLQISQKDEILRGKESALSGIEEAFKAKVQNLETSLREKGELLDLRDAEAKDLKSKVDMLVNLITRVESAAKDAEALAANHAQRADEFEKSLQAEIASHKAQAGEKEDLIKSKENAARGLEESAAKLKDLENRLLERDRLLESRQVQVNELQTKVEMLRIQATEIEKTLNTEIAVLKAQTGNEEEILRAKESVARELEESAAKLKDLENRVLERDQLLESRQAEVNELQSKFQMFEGRALEVERGLKAELVVLRTQAGVQEELLRTNESGARELEESVAKMRHLESQLKAKEQLIEVREAEVKELQSEVEMSRVRAAQMESIAKEAAAERREAEAVEKSLKAELMTLKAQAGQKEEVLRAGASVTRDLEESLARALDLENRLRENDRLLESRQAEVKELQSKIEMFSVRAAQMESVAKEAVGDAQQELASLKAELEEKEEMLRSKGSMGLEEDLAKKIHQLKDVLRDREKLLEVREAEVKELQSKVQMFSVRAAQMESIATEAAAEAQRSDEIERRLKDEIAALKAQVRDKQEMVEARELASQQREEKLAGTIYELEDQLVENREVLELREGDVKHLEFKLANAEESEKDNTAELEKRLAETSAAIDTAETRTIREQMTAEVVKLRAELKEKKIQLAEKERDEWRSKTPTKKWKQMLTGWSVF